MKTRTYFEHCEQASKTEPSSASGAIKHLREQVDRVRHEAETLASSQGLFLTRTCQELCRASAYLDWAVAALESGETYETSADQKTRSA